MPSALGAGRSQIPSLLMIVNIAGILYLPFRGALGRGTCHGKRYDGFQVIDLQTGVSCKGRQVWVRDLLDLIPLLNVVDFGMMCADGGSWTNSSKHSASRRIRPNT